MNEKTTTIAKGLVIVLILLAVVLALKMPATDLNVIPSDVRGQYMDSSGLPYFSEMDSYYNLRMVSNYIDHGNYGDTVVNNTAWDMHRISPDGVSAEGYSPVLGPLMQGLYNIAQMFTNASVKEVAFYAGAIVSIFAIIPAYIFTRRITNDYGAIAAALVITLSPNYFAHTFPGFFDTDMFYMILPLFFILFFIEFMKTDNKLLKVVYAILSMVFIGIFSQAWQGYTFYIGMMVLFVLVYMAFNLYLRKRAAPPGEKFKTLLMDYIKTPEILSIIGFVVLLLIVIIAILGIDGIIGVFNSFISGFSLQAATSGGSNFPNVLISVAEMQLPGLVSGGIGGAFLASTGAVVNGLGGIFCFFIALFVLYIYVSKVIKFRGAKTKESPNKKPPKSKRMSTAKKVEKSKLNLAFTELNAFASHEDLELSKRMTILYAVLFLVWSLSAIAAVSQGSRFVTLLILPFGLLVGVGVGYFADYFKSKKLTDNWMTALTIFGGALVAYPIIAQINWTLGIIVLAILIIIGLTLIYGVKKPLSFKNIPLKRYFLVVLLFLAVVVPSVCGAYYTSDNVVPGTSDPMWDSMTYIQENQANNTVIASWWDFGYLFEIAGDRQTIFDGGSQGVGGRAFWTGKAMTTDNLDLSVGIFRMLGTTGTLAQDYLMNSTDNDTGNAVNILLDILPMSSSDAKNSLMNNHHLSEAQANTVIGYTHPDNPNPVVFVASSDMLQKAGWWTYFGNWDFKNNNATAYQYYVPTGQVQVNPGESGKLNILSENGLNINAVIDRQSGNNSTSAHVETLLENGSVAKINDTDYNPLKASKLLVVEDNYLVKNESIKGSEDGNYTLYLMGYNGTYNGILMSNELENSMFTQLFLLGGNSQSKFSQIHMESGVSLWQVNFDGSSTSTNSTSSTTNRTG